MIELDAFDWICIVIVIVAITFAAYDYFNGPKY